MGSGRDKKSPGKSGGKKSPPNKRDFRPPRGTRYSWADNPHIDERRLVAGNPEPSKINFKLKSTKGKTYDFRYPHQIDWNGKKEVRKAQLWRLQTLSRTLNNGPDTQPLRAYLRWSLREKSFVKALIERRMREKTSTRLTKKDWEQIAKRQNDKWSGEKVSVGENKPLTFGRKKTLVQGQFRKSHVIQDRTGSGIVNQIKKWPDVVAMINELKEEFDWPESERGLDNNDVEEDEEKEDEEEISEDDLGHGGDLDHLLEDNSDDEEDGQRPAAQPNAGRLISAY